MKKALICLALGITFQLPVAARPAPPLERAVLAQAEDAQAMINLLLQVERGDHKGVLQWVAAHPADAQRFFEALLSVRNKAQTAEEKKLFRQACTLLARGLQLQGQMEPMKRVHKLQLVDAALAKLTTEQAQAVAGPVQDSRVDLWMSLQFVLYQIDLGNMGSLPVLLEALNKQAEGIVSGDPNLKRSFEMAVLQGRILSGEYLLARSEGARLLELSRQNRDVDEIAGSYAALLVAAQMGAMPDLTERYLPEFRKAVANVKSGNLPLYRFLLQSLESEWVLSRKPNLDPSEILKRHRECWAFVPKIVPPEDSDGTMLYFQVGSRFWQREMTQLVRRLKREGASKLHAAASAQTASAIEQASRLAQLELAKNRLGLTFGQLLICLDLHSDLLAQGDLEDAASTLKQLQSLNLDELEAMMPALQAEVTKMLPKRLIELLPADYQFDVREGYFSLVRERYCRAQLRQALAEKKVDAQLDTLLEKTRGYQEMALKAMGYQGMDDLRWSELDYLFTAKPSGWQTRAESLLGSLSTLNGQLEYRPGLAQALMWKGELLQEQGKSSEAIASLRQGIDRLESYVSDVGGGQLSASHIRKRYQRGYDLLTRLLIQSGQSGEALDTLGRSQQLHSIALTRQTGSQQAEVVRLDTLQDTGRALQAQIVSERSLGKSSAATEVLLAKNKAEFHQVLSDLRRTRPEFEKRLAIRPVNFAKLQPSILADTTVIQYFPTQDRLYIFVVTQSELKIREVAVGDQQLDALTRECRRLIEQAAVDPQMTKNPASFTWKDDGSNLYLRHSKPLKESLARLYGYLVAPIEADWGQRKVLAIIPTGLLHYVPFPALLKEQGGEVQFLAQRQQCVNIVTVADLARLAQPPAERRPSLFALGNPDGSLPGAEREVAQISKYFSKAQSLMGPKATAEELRKMPAQTGYLHLATHGHLDGKNPTDSYLVTAGKGRFKVGEVYGLNLEGTRLVTLSACQTALEEGQPGSEVTNLAEAFSVAGGNSVLASLWSVSDQGTEILMNRFYQSIGEGSSLSEALQKAELAALQDPKLSHPYFWAPFTLFGDWR